MTRRLLIGLLVLAAGAGATFAVTAAGADDQQRYTAVLDNASQTPTSIWDQCNPGGDMNASGWKAEFTAAAKVDVAGGGS